MARAQQQEIEGAAPEAAEKPKTKGQTRAATTRWGLTWGDRVAAQVAIDFPGDPVAQRKALREAAQQINAAAADVA